MRSQTPPYLLTKCENCRNIIKVPLHVHEEGTPYTGLYREAPSKRGTLFRLQVYERGETSVISV